MDEIYYKRHHRPTFWEGCSSLFDFGGNLHHRPNTDIDHERMAWLLVGKVMWTAMEQFEEETNIRVLADYRRPHELVSHD